MSSMPKEDDRIRAIAGHLLKDVARRILDASPEVLKFAKSAILAALSDPSIMIRNAASGVLVEVLGKLEPRNWPECLQQLVHTLEVVDGDQQEVRTNFNASVCTVSTPLPYSQSNGRVLYGVIHEHGLGSSAKSWSYMRDSLRCFTP